MVLPRGVGDFTRKYRPYTFDDVLGQEAVVNGLKQRVLSKSGLKCFLLYGESGTGKTTLANTFAMAVNCTNKNNGNPCCECSSCLSIMNGSNPDVKEINASDARGIDDIRDLRTCLSSLSIFNSNKVFILDEGHGLTTPAQEALLKIMDSLGDSAYIFICSTDPNKIIKTVRNRCEQYKFDLLSKDKIKFLVDSVCLFEDITLPADISDTVVEYSYGRPRNALVSLQQVVNIGIENKDLILKTLTGINEVETSEVIELCKSITYGKTSWSSVMNIYKNIKSEPEAIRISLAGWFRSLLEKAQDFNNASKAANALSKLVNILPTPKPENSLVFILFQIFNIYK
jgi:DNA polymerase III subunit gamma/tau